jgi:hypothetical protein
MSGKGHGAGAVCAVWLAASFFAPAVLLTDGLFLILLLSGALFLFIGLWAAVPLAALFIAVQRLRQRRYRAAFLLTTMPLIGALLCFGGGEFWFALRRATMPPSYACTVGAAGSWSCPEQFVRFTPTPG